MELRDQTVRPLVDTLTWDEDGRLAVGGSFPDASDTAWELLLQAQRPRRGGRPSGRGDPTRRFGAALCPDAVAGPAGVLPLAEGRWYLFLREPGETGPRPVPPGPCRARPPRAACPSYAPWAAGTSPSGAATTTASSSSRDPSSPSRSAAAPSRPRCAPATRPCASSPAPTRSCTPASTAASTRTRRAPCTRSSSPAANPWSTCGSCATSRSRCPRAAGPSALCSAEWYEALARSRYVVTNTQLPDWFERAEDQYVVQTWHGTPLKRIGRDLADSPSGDRRYIATLPERAAQWNLLVSPNRFSTPVLRRAFGYHGEVLESGYPRNDLLHAADRAKVAAAVRERLGIPEDRRVVLYAPTWREDQPRRGGRYGLDLRLDLAAARARPRRGPRPAGAPPLPGRRHRPGHHVRLRAGRHPLPGRRRTAPDQRRAGHRLLVADVRLRADRPPDAVPHLRPRPLPGHPAGASTSTSTRRRRARCSPPARRSSRRCATRSPRPQGTRRPTRRFREVFCDLDDGRAAADVADAMLPGGRR